MQWVKRNKLNDITYKVYKIKLRSAEHWTRRGGVGGCWVDCFGSLLNSVLDSNCKVSFSTYGQLPRESLQEMPLMQRKNSLLIELITATASVFIYMRAYVNVYNTFGVLIYLQAEKQKTEDELTALCSKHVTCKTIYLEGK